MRNYDFDPHSNCMLTTKDNPYSPFTEFSLWNTWDIGHGYRTNELIGRESVVAYDLSDYEQEQLIADAFQDILDYDVTGMYVVVTEEDYKDVNLLDADESV